MHSTRQWKNKRRKLAAIGCRKILKEESDEMSTTCTLGSVCDSHILQENVSDCFSRSSTEDFQSSCLGTITEAKDASRGQNTILDKSLSKTSNCAKGSSKKRKSVSYNKNLGRKRDATLPSQSKLQSWCKSVSSLDLSNSMTCTPSYRLLPIKYMRQASSLHPLRAQVLNDHWVCVPSDSQNFNLKRTTRNFYEEKLQDCEDDCCEVDVLIESTRATIRRMEVLLNRIDSGEDISLVDNHLTVIDWRCCDRLDDESGLEVKDIIRKDPCTALPVVIDKLKQKQEKLLVSREGFSKSLKEAFLDEEAKSEVKKGCRRSC